MKRCLKKPKNQAGAFRKDFIKLHRQGITHAGIVVCTYNPDQTRLASKIHSTIKEHDSLHNQLIRIYRD